MAQWIKVKNEIDRLEKSGIVKFEVTNNGLQVSNIHHDCDCRSADDDTICLNIHTLYYSKQGLQKLIAELQTICEKVPTEEELMS